MRSGGAVQPDPAHDVEVAIEHRSHLRATQPGHVERHHSAAQLRIVRPIEDDSGDAPGAAAEPIDQTAFVHRHLVHSDREKVAGGSTEAGESGDIERDGFE